jgi:4-hydroxythreonine-4-phosphate dehydrogenase
MTERRPRVAVTMGDPAGIGPEIVARCLFARARAGTNDATAFVIGDAAKVSQALQQLNLPGTVRRIASPDEARDDAGQIQVLQVDELPADLQTGRVDARAGRASFAYVSRAIDLALAGEIEAMVTAPIHKEAWHAAGVTYPGHTEVLAARSGIDDFAMMLFNDELRVVLVSIHVPLRRAIELVTVAQVTRIIRLADKAMRDMGITHPRVAVAGLNPHAGEGGLFGTEDRDTIAPAIAAARRSGIDASGPHAPDTVFMRARRGDFDVVVAQYHDQGLIPLKYMGLDTGVNVTLGLPFVRTSVDHGTAFDIAGRGIADPSSLEAAMAQAIRMTKARARAS